MRLPAVFTALVLVACQGTEPPESSVPDTSWPVYLGDKASSQYSPLAQIDRDNVDKLQLAWQYRAGDLWSERFAQIQTNPLVIDGVFYGLSPRLDLFALDAETGEEIWRFDTDSAGTVAAEGSLEQSLGVSRGMAYWHEGDDRRLFVGVGPYLHAIDADTGKRVGSFGDSGVVDLRRGLDRPPADLFVAITTPGVIYRDLLITGMRVGEGPASAPGHVRAYNVKTGELAWTFHTIPQPGEYGHDTWPEDAWQRIGGANNWAGMSLDEARGIVYVPTGSAAYDFWGGDRLGQNLFANSLLALDAATGERLWHFQTVHHDIWDRDLPAPPNLVTLTHDGETIDAVAQVTKSGFVFVFDRVTGEPLFPIEERPVPPSTLGGEHAWPTQPFPVKPAPFARQRLTHDNLRRDDPGFAARLDQLTSAGAFVPFDTEGVVLFPGFDGGAEWGGAAVSPEGILYINSNEMPWIAKMNPLDQADRAVTGEHLYQQHCASCHGEQRLGGPRRAYPPLQDLQGRLSETQVRDIVRRGQGFMPGFSHLPEVSVEALLAYLWDRPAGYAEIAPPVKEHLGESGHVPYSFDGYHRWVDEQGNPAVEPPWGTLTALDLNTGEYLWRVPLGDMTDSPLSGDTPTGAENYGGPVVTAGGLLFIAATRDQKFRAFDRHSGELLWEYPLPAGGYATPSVYAVNGKQYVAIAAGGGKMGTPSADYYLVFALPESVY